MARTEAATLEEWPPGPFRKLKEAGYTGLWMMRVYKYI